MKFENDKAILTKAEKEYTGLPSPYPLAEGCIEQLRAEEANLR